MSMVDISELDQDKSIDPGQLDVEAVRQADVFFKWAERSIAAKANMDRLEFDLDVLEAKLSLRCREKPEDFGLPTGKAPTEGAVKAAILVHESFIAGTRELQDARRDHSTLTMAVAALEQKKRMIEVLITLHGQEYFAGPSVPRDLVSAWNDHRTKAGAELDTKQVAAARKRVRREP